MRAALLLTAALIAAPAAVAQTNNQHQGGDATAVTTVHAGQIQDAAATSVASGNVVSVTADDADAHMFNEQHMDGDTAATTDALVDSASGNIVGASASIANGATAELRGSTVTIDSMMLSHGDSTATTNFTGGDAQSAATSASAAGNVAAASSAYSDVAVLQTQESTGATRASVTADHGHVSGQVVSGAVASANNLTMSGYTTTLVSRTRQSASGEAVTARVNLNAAHATDASGNATASANSVTIDNQWGYLDTRVVQEASANVAASSEVSLGEHFHGFGSAAAYGVGNQAIASNVGSDMLLNTVQANTGDVSANAAFSGQGGDSALASAAAYGNTVNGALCSQCDLNGVPSLYANNNQTNSGDVSSSATVTSAYANTAAGSATAIGNAATYSARGP